MTDSLGQSIVLTGQQMYVRCNASLLNTGSALSSTPPSTSVVPDVSALAFTFDAVTGASMSGFTGDASDFVCFAFSRWVSPGINFMKTFWQPLGTVGVSGAGASPFAVVLAPYAAEFGAPPAGTKIFVRATPVNAGGFNGTPNIQSAIVTP